MGDEFDSFRTDGGFSSPPCMAGDVAPDCFDPLAVDPQQTRDVARWRMAERTRLIEARKRADGAERREAAQALMSGLATLFDRVRPAATGWTVSFYWPIRNEPDLRPMMAELCAAGVGIALPLVEQRAAPLVFREWTPATRMIRGHWNIPVPPAEAPRVHPHIVLAPLVGWDCRGFRLGYGGGYFDRTLAALSPRPVTIGVGRRDARLDTIFPQPHDIPLDVILTEHGVEVERSGNVSDE